MNTLGVIPAAGKGSRWGNYLKELLPCGNGEWLLDRTAQAMIRGGANALLVVSRPEKVAAHVNHLSSRFDVPVYYVMQRGDNDIWSAIEESFYFPAERYLFAMPDTHFPLSAFDNRPSGVFSIGLHKTNNPERYGVLLDGYMVNKQQLSPGKYSAWGILSWAATAVRFWKRNPPADYTDAINKAIKEYGLDTWQIGLYVDFATFGDYAEWMK